MGHGCAGRELRNAQQVVLSWIRHGQLEQESIELGFGQWIGAFHFDRVLRRQYEKRLWQGVGSAAGGYPSFLHGFEQRRLSLGRSAIDLVGQHQVGKERTWLKLERAAAIGPVAQ